MNSGLTQVLSDGANTYLYGVERIAQVNASTLLTDYFLTDSLGSVRQVTDQSGELTYARAFDPFGVVTQTYGASQTDYGYTGEYTANDLVYLRARHYSPEMGRFFTRDPFPGFANFPQSQNPYSYAWNNPVMYTDPSGQTPAHVIAAIIAAILAGGGNLQHQLNRNGGNWECVDWGEVALWAAGGAVAGLIIATALPVLLASPDTTADLLSLAYSAYTGDAVGFALDAISLMIPGVTGLSTLNRAGDALQTLNRVDSVADITRAVNRGETVADTRRFASNACNSFSADTDVVTDEGDKPISQIQIGDYVLAWDEETNSISFYPVTDTIHHTDEVVVHLTIDGEEIETTPEHPFFVEGTGWTDAEDLQLGDDIRKADGSTGEVESIEIEETQQEMYNLTVDEAHTFFVGDGQWLVHNAGVCPTISYLDVAKKTGISNPADFTQLRMANLDAIQNRVPSSWSQGIWDPYFGIPTQGGNRAIMSAQWKLNEVAPSGYLQEIRLKQVDPRYRIGNPYSDKLQLRWGIQVPGGSFDPLFLYKNPKADQYFMYFNNKGIAIPRKDELLDFMHIPVSVTVEDMNRVYGGFRTYSQQEIIWNGYFVAQPLFKPSNWTGR